MVYPREGLPPSHADRPQHNTGEFHERTKQKEPGPQRYTLHDSTEKSSTNQATLIFGADRKDSAPLGRANSWQGLDSFWNARGLFLLTGELAV